MNKLTQGKVLTLVDTTGIQDYIFSSNILTHIVGASGLVHQITHEWLREVLAALGRHNLDDPRKTIEGDHLEAELIYSGGGNALLIFSHESLSREFALQLSRKALQRAAGLEMVIVHENLPDEAFTPEARVVSSHLREIQKKAQLKKVDRQRSSPLLGLGVTAACPYTQKPASRQLEQEWVSTEIFQKATAGYDFAEKYLAEKFKQAADGYAFMQKFGDISGAEKGSYLAVVHADGTGTGARLVDWIKKNEDQPDRQLLGCLKEFSQGITAGMDSALSAVIEKLRTVVKKEIVPHAAGALPLRIMVFDGDDVTFACDGRVGLQLAALFLEELSRVNLPDGKGPVAGRAGVAIVKSHFPFSQAYQLAEQLSRSARAYARQRENDAHLPTAPMAMDWHISTSGLVNRLDYIREQAYRRAGHTLLMRPLIIGNGAEWRSWRNFQDICAAFCNRPDWAEKHSKLKEYFTRLIEGQAAVKKFLEVNPGLPELPPVPGYNQAAETGFIGHVCAYHDAIEAMDFFLLGT